MVQLLLASCWSKTKKAHGYDAQSEEYCDMFAKGIIDPVKVVRTALQDAASICWIVSYYRSHDC